MFQFIYSILLWIVRFFTRFHKKPQINETIVIFTRYPQIGFCKTRLFNGGLSKEAATIIHKELTEHIVRVARNFKFEREKTNPTRNCKIILYYNISKSIEDKRNSPIFLTKEDEKITNLEMMENWLGKDIQFIEQVEGDLSTKIKYIANLLFSSSPKNDNDRVIFSASDTPGITIDIFEQAFDKLNTNEVVIGPAEDGGYYFIGFSVFHPELIIGANVNGKFINIPWSTSDVFRISTYLCNTLHFTYSTQLPMLSDIDYPKDLQVWKAELSKYMNKKRTLSFPKISVIVPVLNEEKNIWETLESISAGVNIEIIVVDGQSSDNTVQLVNLFKEKMHDYILLPKDSYSKLLNKDIDDIEALTSKEYVDIKIIEVKKEERGRALQQNKGVSQSNGDILLFVHGDTTLPRGYDSYIRQCLSSKDGKPILGAFKFGIEDKNGELSRNGRLLTHFTTNLRAKYLQLPYGDQCLFLKKSEFIEQGGFPILPFMEDFEFVRRFTKKGRVKIIDQPAITSGRRWKKLGLEFHPIL